MRFTARQTTKNMCVIAMLIFVLLISAFWGMQYYDSAFETVKCSGRLFPALSGGRTADYERRDL